MRGNNAINVGAMSVPRCRGGARQVSSPVRSVWDWIVGGLMQQGLSPDVQVLRMLMVASMLMMMLLVRIDTALRLGTVGVFVTLCIIMMA